MGWASTWDDSTPASSLQPTKAEPPKKGGDGIGGSLGKGIMSGGASVGRAAELAGAAPLVIADKVAGTDLAQRYFEAVDPVFQSADDYWRIDPETGHVGQVAYGLGRIVLPLAAGAGNPTTMMAGEASNAAVTGTQQGATNQEATNAAAVTALTFGVGAMVPGAVGGNAVTKIGSGAAINTAIGVGYREGMQSVYADNPGILKTLPDPRDPTALATDATIGAAFGGIAALASRNRNRPLPDRDAEAQAQVASHVDQVTQATSPQQRQAHADNLTTAQRQMRDGEAVQVAQQAQARDARSLVSASRAPVQQADLSRLPSGAQVVAEAAHSAGIEASLALAMAHHETGGRFNSDAQNPDSSAHGIGQITDATWQQYGGGNRADPKEQARVMMEVIKAYRQDAAGVLGRDPTAGETYLAYQWGPGGFAKAMRDPTAKVDDVIGAKAAKSNGWTGKTVAQALEQTNARFDRLVRLYGGQARGGVAYTASGDQVAYAYQVMEAGDLTASHLPDLSVNPAFPPELQPRDRTRAASEDQISQIDLSLQPARLMDSPMVTDGAPIVGLDGVVESGNGRTLAIGRHYERGDPNGYRQALLDNADALGLLRSEIEQMQRPVLVRTRLSDVADRAAFARDANASTVAAMSASERAASDVSRLPDAALLAVRDDGTINMAGSMNYVRGFVDALPETERASMMTADGHLSQEGQRRIETAIVHQAYGDGALVERLSEHTDAQGKNILSALVRSAAPLAQLDALVRQGGRHENTVARDVAEAAQRYSDIRASGQTVHDYLQQNSLLDDGLSDGARSMLEVMGDNSRSPKAIAEEIQRRIDAVEQMGDPRQGGLFGEAVPEPVPKAGTPEAVASSRFEPIVLHRITRAEFDWNRQKPQGIYATIVDNPHAFESPFADDFGADAVNHRVIYHPENPLYLPPTRADHARFGSRGSGSVSAGVAALKALLPKDSFEAAMKFNKQQVIDAINHEFPGVDTSRVHDAYDALEIWGAQEAKRAGHDILVYPDPDMPMFSEAVLLDGAHVPAWSHIKLDENGNEIGPRPTHPQPEQPTAAADMAASDLRQPAQESVSTSGSGLTNQAQAWHTPDTPEQQAAFDLMQQNPDLVLANEAGEPVSVRDVMAQLEAEHAMTREQTTATEAAVSCALQFGD